MDASTWGDLADGQAVSAEERDAARRAIREKGNDGARWFVSVHVAHLENVDTEELFFTRAPRDGLDLDDEANAFRHGVVALDVLLDRAAWERAAGRWTGSEAEDHGPVQWNAFVTRVAQPLALALGLEAHER